MDRIFKRPLSLVYGGVVGLRNRLFDSGLRTSHKVKFPVISVGNLTVGGTGKTPCIIMLAEHFLNQGKQVSVVSRGYGRNTKGHAEVLLTEDAPAEFGDEPVLIKSRLPSLSVFVGAHRGKLLQELAQTQNFDLALADDAYQHRQLHRDLNILIVDALAPIEGYQLLPLGKLREPLEQICRADIVIISKVNLVSAEKLQQVRELIQPYLRKSALVFESALQMQGLVTLLNEKAAPKTAILVSAVGQPSSVERTVQDHIRILQHLSYPDHHPYSSADADSIVDAFRKSGADAIVTTAKDAVKLHRFTVLRPYLRIAEVSMSINQEKSFYERLDQIFS